MKKWENGVIMDMTPEEEAEMERQTREAEEMERNRPLTAEELLEILVLGVSE